MSQSFQTSVNYQPGNAVAGDFASNNPRSVVLAGPGGLVAGTGGLNIATFGWVQSDGVTVLNNGQGAPSGFASRQDMNALITTYGAGYGVNVPAGFGVTLYNGGDFFAKTLNAATVGQSVFASYVGGNIECAAAGVTIAGATITASVSTTVLTVTAQSVNPILVGDLVIGLSPPTYIASFGTGTGSAGTYNLTTSGATGTPTATTSYVQTPFIAGNSALANTLVKISSKAL